MAVEVPPSVQAIVDRMLARCAALSQGGVGAGIVSPTAARPGPSTVVSNGGSAGPQDAHDDPGRSLPANAESIPRPSLPSVSSAAHLQLLGLGRFPVVTSSLTLLKLLDEYLVLQVMLLTDTSQ